MNRRNYLVVAVAGMFCWLNASVVPAQTATNFRPLFGAEGILETSSDILEEDLIANQGNRHARLLSAFGTPESRQADRTEQAINTALRGYTTAPGATPIEARMEWLGRARAAAAGAGDHRAANKIQDEIFRLSLIEQERLSLQAKRDAEIAEAEARAELYRSSPPQQ